MNRLRFSKTGTARYCSHLDLLRTFQRAFRRAGIRIRCTEGFNKHEFVSIALPLSVGFESHCELIDFDLIDALSPSEVVGRLNLALPGGIVAHECYDSARPVKELLYVDWTMTFEYDSPLPHNLPDRIQALTRRGTWVVQKPSKKAKSGFVNLDLIPLIRSISAAVKGCELHVDAVLSAQNPGLNPQVLMAAVRDELGLGESNRSRYLRNDVIWKKMG